MLEFSVNRIAALALVGLVFFGCAGTGNSLQEPIERGWVERSVLARPEHQVFQTVYDTVKIDNGVADLIAKVDSGVDITVFFGTWCPDSRRQVPRFFRVADRAGIAPESIRLYALDRTKKSSDGLTDKYRIEKVPTFIFLKNGDEIGRITESPTTTIEGDMLAILAGSQR